MRILRNRLKGCTFAVVLVLTVGTMLTTSLPITAILWPPTPTPSTAFLFMSPNPVGVGQLVTINAWIHPPPIYSNRYYYDYHFIFTDPDGVTDTIVIPQSEQPGTVWFFYVCDKVGTWTVQFTWDGSDTPTGPSGNATACSTAKQPLVVQQDPIPAWPAAPLPTDYEWNWPVNMENREWIHIMGPWLMSGYNASRVPYNQYSEAPDSSHILWKNPPMSGIGGIIGGEWGAGQYYSSSRYDIEVVMAGKAYSDGGGNIQCWDTRTGEMLWEVPGSVSMGYIERGTPYIYSIGSTFRKYNALTGEMTLEVDGMSPQFTDVEEVTDPTTGYKSFVPYAYSLWNYTLDATASHGLYYSGARLIKWDLSGSTGNFANRVVWNVTWPLYQMQWGWSGALGGGMILHNVYYPAPTAREYPTAHLYGIIGLDAETGDWVLNVTAPGWGRYEDDFQMGPHRGVAYGNFFWSFYNMTMVAYDIHTGERNWVSEQADYPWGHLWAYSATACYGMIYMLNYAGAYAINATTGKYEWHYSTGSSMPWGETPYGTWPLRNGPVAADGKIYGGTAEWGTPSPYYRGQQLHCIDAFEGTKVWSIMGSWSPRVVAEGYLFADNAYDGCSYCFGKGKTATTASVSESTIAKGSSVWITGTVTDQSPAQPDTPCVSKESMSDWMEYLHMQQPLPHNTTGVPVHLYAMAADGTQIDIGSTTTTCDGNYRYKWTPPDEDYYIISATFFGDESYYSSWDQAGVAVGPEPTPYPESPTAQEVADEVTGQLPAYSTMDLALIALVAIAIIIGIVNLWALRKR